MNLDRRILKTLNGIGGNVSIFAETPLSSTELQEYYISKCLNLTLTRAIMLITF